MKGAEAIVEALKREGVKHIFGITGGAIMIVYDVLHDEKDIKHILMRHEQCAAHAAEGYARASGKVGVCMATSGPGATNLITGITDAYMDSSPIVAFTGQVPTNLIGGDSFQEADIIGMTMPITKYNFQIKDPKNIGRIIKSAFKIASSGRPGPVVVDLPKDVQLNEAKVDFPKEVDIPGFKPKLEGHPVQIKKAVKMLLNAQYPVIISGGGVVISGASEELMKIAELLGTPVVTTLMGKGSFPESHPLCLGMAGMHGRKVANWALTQADVIVTIGMRFSDRITGSLDSFAQDAKVIHIDIDPAEIGKNVKVDLPIVGDAKLILKDLLKVLLKMTEKRKTVWTDRVKELKEYCECNLNYKGSPVDPRTVIHIVKKFVKDDDIIVTGVGRHQMFAAHYFIRNKPRTFISSGGLGTMGFGFPAAVGAKVACPDVEVIDYDGDGSFQMTGKELATCKENGIKVIAIITHDKWLGMVHQWTRLFLKERYSHVYLGEVPDFVKYAEAFGLDGMKANKPSEVKEALKAAKKSDETFVIDIDVNSKIDILPMMPAGGSLDQFFGPCIKKSLLEDIKPVRK